MKEKTKLLSCLIAAVIAGSALSVNVYAESDVRKKVRVVVENNTLSVSDGADWTGTLADEWVELHDDTTAKDAFLTVLNTNGFTQQGAEFDYITNELGTAVPKLVSGSLPEIYGDMKLKSWLETRRNGKRRTDIARLLRNLGMTDIKSFIDISLGLTLTDTLWVTNKYCQKR